MKIIIRPKSKGYIIPVTLGYTFFVGLFIAVTIIICKEFFSTNRVSTFSILGWLGGFLGVLYVSIKTIRTKMVLTESHIYSKSIGRSLVHGKEEETIYYEGMKTMQYMFGLVVGLTSIIEFGYEDGSFEQLDVQSFSQKQIIFIMDNIKKLAEKANSRELIVEDDLIQPGYETKYFPRKPK